MLDEWEANGIWNDSRAGWNYFDPTIQEFMTKFEQADTNNDGQISAGEMYELFGANADIDAIKHYYNWDDTETSLSEYEAKWAYYDYVHGYGIWCPIFQDFVTRFEAADTDGDNFLNPDEIRDFLCSSGTCVEIDMDALLQYYDYMNEGGLDYWMASWAHQEQTHGYGFFDPEPWIDEFDPDFMQIWADTDTDGDGFATIEEITASLGADLADLDIAYMVSLYDWDDSTHLCPTESLFAYNDYMYGRGVFEGIHDEDEGDCMSLFEDLDANDDMGVSVQELDVLTGDDYDTEALHSHYDADGSGQLEMNEFCIMYTDQDNGTGFFDGLDDDALEEIEECAYEIIRAVEELQDGLCEDCEDCDGDDCCDECDGDDCICDN